MTSLMSIWLKPCLSAGCILRLSFELRSDADYDVLKIFNKEEIEQSYNEMKEIISEIEKLIKST